MFIILFILWFYDLSPNLFLTPQDQHAAISDLILHTVYLTSKHLPHLLCMASQAKSFAIYVVACFPSVYKTTKIFILFIVAVLSSGCEILLSTFLYLSATKPFYAVFSMCVVGLLHCSPDFCPLTCFAPHLLLEIFTYFITFWDVGLTCSCYGQVSQIATTVSADKSIKIQNK